MKKHCQKPRFTVALLHLVVPGAELKVHKIVKFLQKEVDIKVLIAVLEVKVLCMTEATLEIM